MNKRTFTLTTDQANELFAAQTQTKHGTPCFRYLAVRLSGTGYAVETIQAMTGCGRTSLMEWCAAYRSHGLDGLRDKRTGGHHRKLTSNQVIDLTNKLRQYTPRSLFGSETVASGEYWTLLDLRRAIQYWYGVTYQSDTSYRSLFQRCGFSYHRPSRIFRSRNQRMVHDFEDQIEKKMDVTQDAPETVLLAEDEATVYLQATTTAIWAPKGEYPPVRVDGGRSKTHFYGTWNLQTGIEIVTRSERMTSESTATHLQALLDAYPDQPMVLLWDRAPWHRGVAVRQVLEDTPRLEILFFPTASPDRNPQEHVWKATRLAVSHHHRVTHLPKLADQFAAYLPSHRFPSTFLKK